MVDPIIREIISPSITWPVPWDSIELNFGPPPDLPPNAIICQVCAYSLMRVTGPRAQVGPHLKVMGATIGDKVYLNIKPEDLDTAAGRALAAHEFWHVHQARTMQDFDGAYAMYAARTPDDQPWLNPLEREAYVVERQEYSKLIRQGYPPGRWKPLGVELWGLA